LEAHRQFYADLITTSAGAGKNERLKDAFASTPRERFTGTGPWKVFVAGNYIETPTDDPAFLYQDVLVALAPERRINNGQPVLHAINLAALNVKRGEKVLHVGAGTGYYTALLARLTGAAGAVVAYEIEHDLAQNAIRNLSDFPNVTVQERSGSEAPLPVCDAIYVNAGATAPLNVWLARIIHDFRSTKGPAMVQIRCLRGFETKSEAFA
jgi:protein-L-isoaspartate(D-aspartate) O-methyltransferase